MEMLYKLSVVLLTLQSALGEKLGYGPKYVIFRKIMHRMDQAKKRPAEKDENLIVSS